VPPPDATATIAVEVHPTVSLVAAEDGLAPRLRATLEERVGALMRTLGVPGGVDVAVRAGDGVDPPAWLRLWINGVRYRYDRDMEWRARIAALGSRRAGTDTEAARILQTARECMDVDPRTVVDLVTATVMPVVGDHAGALMAGPQAAAYAAGLGNGFNPDRMADVLRRALDLKVSVADHATVARVLNETSGDAPADAAEAVRQALTPASLEVRVGRAFLRELTTNGKSEFPGVLGFVRDAMFDELGIFFPPLRIVATDAPARIISLVVNDVELVGYLGLEPGDCMVNGPPARVAESVPQATVRGWVGNPGTGVANTRVAHEDRAMVEAQGWTTWSPVGHMALAVAADLRRHARCLVELQQVRQLMDRLDEVAPVVVRAARARLSELAVARVLRGLVAEQESCRNLPTILERLMHADEATLGDRAALDAWVRGALRRAITGRQTRANGSVAAYLVDQRIEALLRGGRATPKDEAAIAAAIRREVEKLPDEVALPSVLTTADVRLALVDAVADEFPRLAVLSYDDLPPSVEVLPVARIKLDDAMDTPPGARSA
jgi:type III secretory pathway component EscV